MQASSGLPPTAVALAVVLLAAVSVRAAEPEPTAPDAAAHEIRLHRPVRAGQSYRMAAVGRQEARRVVTSGGKVVQDKARSFSVDFESVVTILKADANGKSLRQKHVVVTCTRFQDGRRTTLIAKGKVVIASAREADTAFDIDGRPVDKDVAEALSLVVGLSRDTPTDDQLFGTPDRQRVGQSWPVNATLAAAGMRKRKLPVKDEDVSGTVTLEKLTKVGHTDCLQIAVDLAAKNLPLPLPRDVAIQRAELQVKLLGFFPIDASRQPIEKTREMRITLRSTATPDPAKPELTYRETVVCRATKKTRGLD